MFKEDTKHFYTYLEEKIIGIKEHPHMEKLSFTGSH
jgi:hypothetical protein